MANTQVKDASGATIYHKASGAGTDIDPRVPSVAVDSSGPPTGAATAAHQVTQNGYLDGLETALAERLTEADFDTKTGALTEAAPATDTASSGLNGRLQRIAQRLTSLIAQLPAALVGGRLDVNIGAAPATVTVDLGVNNDVTVTGTVTANAGTNLNTSALALEAGGNLAGLVTRVGEVQASPTANTVLDRLKALLTGIVLAAGANLVGRFNPEPQTTGGLSISRVISAATTNATPVKASAGQVYSLYVANVSTGSVRYLKLYNKASAPTVGTDTPVMTIPIPGTSITGAAGAGVVIDTGGMGIAFATGIAFALTTGVADADTGAVAANEIVVNLLYK